MVARVWADPTRKRLVAQSAIVSLTAPAYYFGYCEVTGLQPGKVYWYDIYADDGAGNSAVTTGVHEQGKFMTIPADSRTPVRLALLGCLPLAPNYSLRADAALTISQRLNALGINFAFAPGDNVYRDLYNTVAGSYCVPGTWINANTEDDWSVDALLTNYITAYSFLGVQGKTNRLAQFYANTPVLWTPDDHDRAYNDCDDRINDTANAVRWSSGISGSQRFCINLNKQTIEAEGRAFTPESSQEMYCYADIGDVRVALTDHRTFRSNRDAADGPNKTILGDVQKEWLKNLMRNNPCKFFIWMSPGMLDGLHDWTDPADLDTWLDTGTTSVSAILDSYPTFESEQKELLDFICGAENAAGVERTLIVCSDTHFCGVSRFKRNNKYLYEVDAGNFMWIGGGHGFLNYFNDGELIRSIHNATCIPVIDVAGGQMTVTLYITEAYGRSFKERVVWRRCYR